MPIDLKPTAYVRPWLLACALLVCVPSTSFAVLITIDFEADTAGAKPNGFTPVGISGVLFSDSVGAQLSVDNFGAQGDGQSLAVQQDDDASELEIDLGFTSDFISLDFGNDDPGNTNPGDIAVLTAFLGAVQVGQETLLLNRDGLMNQTIMFGVIGGATLFDIATFAFTDSTFDLTTGGFPFNTDFGSTEIVDNISINALQVQVQVQVPEPATILLIGLGVLGLNRKF